MSTNFDVAPRIALDSEDKLNSLLVTWQNPQTTRYYLMGSLQKSHSLYRFAYYPESIAASGFRKIPGFPDVQKTYESSVLFPLFSSRLMSSKRSDRKDWLRSFELSESSDDFLVLARSLGRRVGDNFELFEEPTIDLSSKKINGTCPVHGLRHQAKGMELLAAGGVTAGQPLEVVIEDSNSIDPRARLVRTISGVELGYLPRPLLDYIDGLGFLSGVPMAKIEYVNANRYELHQQIQIAYEWCL